MRKKGHMCQLVKFCLPYITVWETEATCAARLKNGLVCCCSLYWLCPLGGVNIPTSGTSLFLILKWQWFICVIIFKKTEMRRKSTVHYWKQSNIHYFYPLSTCIIQFIGERQEEMCVVCNIRHNNSLARKNETWIGSPLMLWQTNTLQDINLYIWEIIWANIPELECWGLAFTILDYYYWG